MVLAIVYILLELVMTSSVNKLLYCYHMNWPAMVLNPVLKIELVTQSPSRLHSNLPVDDCLNSKV